MTVRRHSHDYFDAAPSAVASAVRTVLSSRPPYVKTSETEKGAMFKTNVKPSCLLLGTDMTIQLQPSSGGTQIIAKTQSQFFILGDIFNCYNRYIENFLRDLRTELQRQQV
jgi:hypothetical protein